MLTLNRPDKLNAINAAMIEELDARARCGRGGRAGARRGARRRGPGFSAGFDLDMETGDGRAPIRPRCARALQQRLRIIMRFWDSPKLTIAAVHGYCLGSAMELALACDLTIAAEDCCFGAPEVRFGSGIVALLLPWLVGPKQAKRLLLTGDDRVSRRARPRAWGS